MTRATVYFEEDLHRALKLKAAESDFSISDLVNDAVRSTFAEDLEDLEEIERRRGEKTISYEAFLKKLKSNGRL